MAKAVKKSKENKKTISKKNVPVNKDEQNIAVDQIVDYTRDSLMPELEELVKKNPNRLIGCGG
ncbi:MAG: hypothetical protein U0U67_06755 [Chitinophagales bacterium]